MRKKLTLEEVNQRLREANSEYKCEKYVSGHSSKTLFIHIESGKKGKSTYVNILAGSHPSWSPSCKSRQDIDETIANQRLEEANSEYRCEKYEGTESLHSLFIHIPTNTGPKESIYRNILKGKHPKWSPTYKKRKKEMFLEQTLTLEEVNQRLKEANSEYKCEKYVSYLSPNSLFIHIPTNTGPLPSMYGNILKGQHPSWSPALNCNRPSNDKLCIVYFCKTKTYGLYDKYKNGPYLTIGVTTGNTKTRYRQNGLIKTYFQTETYDCLDHEQALLNQITETIGPPEAGHEAWKWTKEREQIIKKIVGNYLFICQQQRQA